MSASVATVYFVQIITENYIAKRFDANCGPYISRYSDTWSPFEQYEIRKNQSTDTEIRHKKKKNKK